MSRTEGPESVAPPTARAAWSDLLIAIGITAATILTYSRVFGFGFVSYDDSDYVLANPHLRETDPGEILKWLFLSFNPDNWFPVTRLSLILDYRLFELDARWYHAENVLIHALVSVLLFWFLRGSAASRWPAALAAAVFALHPLHVESVAWVSERKDVLCALFWFATLIAWRAYRIRPGRSRYVLMLGLAMLCIMSKPMAVTLPLILITTDVFRLNRKLTGRTVMEVLPVAAASASVALLTYTAQSTAVRLMDVVPLALRVQNTIYSVAMYLENTFWPVRLWAPYSWPRSYPVLLVASWAGILVLTVLMAIRLRRTHPWFAEGWAWFCITLVPVIGIVQAGPQARADRYMYIPMAGVLIIATRWLQGCENHAYRRVPTIVLALCLCAGLAVRSNRQTSVWSSGEALFDHAIEMDPANYVAMSYRAQLFPRYRAADAARYYQRALEIRPEDAGLHHNLAGVLCYQERKEECFAEFETALFLAPNYPNFRQAYALELAQAGRISAAIQQLEAALNLKPDYIAAHADLGALLLRVPNREAEGIQHIERGVRLNPRDALGHSNFGSALARVSGREEEAIREFETALSLDQKMAKAHRGLATILARRGLSFEASIHLEAAKKVEEAALAR